MVNFKNILFVCTGNSCRSIMAEAYFNKRVEEKGLCVKSKSAGTFGIYGLKPSFETIEVLKEEKIDFYDYFSKPLTKDLVDWADIILVMTAEHREGVLAIAPNAKEKIIFLGKFRKNQGDVSIPDPIGRSLSFYRVTLNIIKQSIEGLLEESNG
ncbi:protein-tyrosine-phosphatase [Candidatus Omnitrophus magneticus]|uniref:protein-tyrosine-phosphatase n=1 Tax=Candidatus Omnitrophus magneticus TaxID=1609969 RepID=A0A0F0CQG5_9BACT|nr:protein-tyrosine-phosphatase [Candidatus Omnitrophus magneticus]